MKRRDDAESPSDDWQTSMRLAIRKPKPLLELLELDPLFEAPDDLADANDFADAKKGLEFPLFVTREYASRMKIGDWHDPLLRQVWIDHREGRSEPGFKLDPVGDRDVEIAPGLLQKYQGRVLLITTGACAIHCRYCFRRHYPYSSAPKSLSDWLPALDRIESDRSIKEVILSGGDPLTIVDTNLTSLVSRLDKIEHLERLRIHTRLPIVLPQRVNEEMLDWLGASRLSKWVVIHTNHPQEIDENVADAIDRLRSAGATLLNQAVLLKGINDSVDTQELLCQRLLKMSVIPYYLNQLDRVIGARHFETEIEVGVAIVKELAKRLPGYGVPRFVQEQSGQPNKTRIA